VRAFLLPFLAAVPVLASLFAPRPVAAARPSPPDDAVARLAGGALTSGRAFSRAAELADGVGARLAGSPGADAAVAWPAPPSRAALPAPAEGATR
jgi:hypothetical protein